MNQKLIREEYYNRITDLQHKKRDKKDQFLLLALLLVYLMEYLTNGNEQVIAIKAPFLLQTNITNPSKFMRQLNEGLSYRGVFAEPLKRFNESNMKTLETLTTIVPQHPFTIDKKNRFKDALERTDSLEQNNLGTQRDSKVRRTEFHMGIDGQEVAIMDNFQVGAFQARYPADSMLPMFDRINCRCYMTFR